MSAPKTLPAVFIVMALAVFVPRLAWVIIDTFALGHVDSKFGAWDGILFAAFFMGIAATVAGLVAVVLVAIFLAVRKSGERFSHQVTALIAGLVLSIASFWIPDLFVYGVGYAVFGETGMVIVNWAAICGLVFLLIRVAAERLPPNSALLTDTSTSPLRARHGAAKRER